MKPIAVICFLAALVLIAIPACAQTFTGCYAHHPQYIDDMVTTNLSLTQFPALQVPPAT